MKISIAMATYNGAKYLQEQLDSFVAQTRQPDELVVCDDCSNDETVQILEEFAQTAPFEVKIFINEENLGYAQNFGRALSLCIGDLIFLSDQDDIWFPQKITEITQLAKQDNYNQIFMNDANIVLSDLSTTGLTKQSQIMSAGLSKSQFVMGCCMAVRKEFLIHLLPVPNNYAHDVWLSKIAEGLSRRLIIEDSFQLYRRHDNNESTFIANKITKITKLNLFIDKLNKKIGNTKKIGQDDKEGLAYKTQVMINRLNTWLEITDDSLLQTQLEQFIISQTTLKLCLEKRLTIRQMPLLKRLIKGWQFYRDDNYRQFSGIFSYLEDIFNLSNNQLPYPENRKS